jgi:hypothetical protein
MSLTYVRPILKSMGSVLSYPQMSLAKVVMFLCVLLLPIFSPFLSLFFFLVYLFFETGSYYVAEADLT